MGFQKTVLIVALVILTICIIFVATVISKNESNKKWPPEVATCPPYYFVKNTPAGEGPLGVNGMTICERDPNAPKIGEDNNMCKRLVITQGGKAFGSDRSKCNWANNCKIQWDGISSPDCGKRSNLPSV
tara:strand:+ start:725 stop:1111 length:387 start_codon:yes stop_codon:yes gene_type:complete